MVRYSTTIDSTKNASDAFDYMATFSNARRWDPSVATGTALTSGPPTVGSRYRLDVRMGGRSVTFDYEILELERPVRVVLQAERGPLRSRDTITVEPTDSGSRVHYDAVLEPVRALHLVAPLADVFLRRPFKAMADRATAGLSAELA